MISQRGRCVWNQCYALFLKPVDLTDAKKSCEDAYGTLFDFSSGSAEEALTGVVTGVSGRFWLRSTNSTGRGLCSFVSVTMEGNLTQLFSQCSDKLDGFLCAYSTETPCPTLSADREENVRYVTYAGFEAIDSEMFLPGTIAEKLDGEYPGSKHLCFSGSWVQAPWNCEVMGGGCEYGCNGTTNTCTCPTGQTLHPNNVTCTKEPCADCALTCQDEGGSYVCQCPPGHTLAPDRQTCVDVDECKEASLCTGEGRECVNTQGGYECTCIDGLAEEDGACVNVSICEMCEHLLCEKSNGVYGCNCRKGFRVSAKDPTMCELHCALRDCPATCIRNPEKDNEEQCFCPDGYIRDTGDDGNFCTDIDECEYAQCDHKCINQYGSYTCECDEGYTLHSDSVCLPEDEENGSGSSPSLSTPANVRPDTVPSYIKTGSVLGITVFVLLCAGLLGFLVRTMSKRCGKFELSPLKHADLDIFYLQQVTTDTYKRLSFDRQF